MCYTQWPDLSDELFRPFTGPVSHKYMCICMCVYMCAYVCMYVCMYMCVWIYVCVCIYVCIYIYVCMYMYVCVYKRILFVLYIAQLTTFCINMCCEQKLK